VSATESSMPTDGRWGWYRDHLGEEKQRMSKLLEHCDTDRFYLDRYKTGQIVVGMAARDDLVIAAKALGRPGVLGYTRTQKDTIYDLAKKASEAAKDMDGAITGSAIHTLTERVDRGEPVADVVAGLPFPWNTSILAYAKLRELNGWRSIEIERTVEIEELDVRGSFDRIDFVPGLATRLGAGTCQYGHAVGDHVIAVAYDSELPVVVDVKTEEYPWKNGMHIAPQLAGYSRARKMWLPAGEHKPAAYVPMPCVRQDVAIVVHVRDGDAVPYFVNLAEGWETVLRAAAQRDAVRRAKRDLGVVGAWFAPVPGVVRPRVAEIATDMAVINNAAKAAAEAGAGAVLATLPPAGNPVDAAFGTPPPITDTTQLHPAYVMEAGGPDHYAAGLGQLLVDACTRGDVNTIERIAADPYLPGDDLDHARGALAALRAPAPMPPLQQILTGPLPGAIATADDVARTAERIENEHQQWLVDQIWRADTRDDLARLYAGEEQIGFPVRWAGPVKMAGEARLRIIECAQRALHNPATTAKCACGWVPAVRP
jgi:hypothetical protein